MLRKVTTAVRLIAQGDSAKFQEKLIDVVVQSRLWLAQGKPIVYKHQGFHFVCFPTRPDSYEWYRWSHLESQEFAVLQRWLQPGDYGIDVGANIGAYTALMAQLIGAQGRVIAVEPSTVLCQLLHKTSNLLSLNNIVIESCCVSDQKGITSFFEAKENTPTPWQSMRLEDELQSKFNKLEVATRTIDDIWNQYAPDKVPALVKIDIEGAEVTALNGATELLRSPDQPLWLIEINPSCLARFEDSPQAILQQLDLERFELWLVRKALPTGETVRPCLKLDETFEDAYYYNLICLPNQGVFSSRTAAVTEWLQSIANKY